MATGEFSLEYHRLDKIAEWPKNPKGHAEGELASSITEHGFCDPGMRDERTGRLVEGHGRLKDLQRRMAAGEGRPERVHVDQDGMWLMPVLCGVSFKDDAEARRYLLRHNKVGEAGGWHPELLPEFLTRMRDDGIAIDDLAFAPVELRRLFRQATAPAAPQARDIGGELAKLRERWGTEAGQVWRIPSATVKGEEHRIYCGDCRNPEGVKLLLGARRPVLGLHDPPYGIAVIERRTGQGEVPGSGAAVRNRYLPVYGDGEPFDPTHLLGSADRLVLWGANNYAHLLPPSAGWLVWDKRVTLDSNSFSDAELAWVSEGGSVRIYRHMWNGMIRASEHGEVRLHPTQKPVALCAEIIEAYTDPGELVHDAYLGGGSTVLAAELAGRVCYAAELDPRYVAYALERLKEGGLEPRR